jgi:hypothetical protein
MGFAAPSFGSVETTSARQCHVLLSGIAPVYLFTGDFIDVRFLDDLSVRDLVANRAAEKRAGLRLPKPLAKLLPGGLSTSYPLGPNIAHPIGLQCLTEGVLVSAQVIARGETFVGRGYQSVLPLNARDRELLAPETQSIVAFTPDEMTEPELLELNAEGLSLDGVFSITQFRRHHVVLSSGQQQLDLEIHVGDLVEIEFQGDYPLAAHYSEALDLEAVEGPLWDLQVLQIPYIPGTPRTRHRPLRKGVGRVVVYERLFQYFSPEFVPEKLAEVHFRIVDAPPGNAVPQK